MHLSDLKLKHVTELVDMAIANELEGTNRLRKHELVFALLKHQAKKGESIFVLQHPKAAPLKVASGGLVEAEERRIWYAKADP